MFHFIFLIIVYDSILSRSVTKWITEPERPEQYPWTKPDLYGNEEGDDFRPECAAILPIFDLWNHHLDPNCHWGKYYPGDTVEIFTQRDIRVGDELFLSYIPEIKADVQK